MTYPLASGATSQSGIMVPEIWSGKLLVKFYEATVLAAISNTDYEGEIKQQGDKVNIRTTPSIIIKDHVKGQKLDYDTPKPELVTLIIDKGKYWGFVADDLDKAQADYQFVNDWTTDASEQMKITIDKDVLGDIYSDVASENSGQTAGKISGDIDLGVSGSPLGIHKGSVLELFVDFGTILDEQNIPESGRWIVAPAWMCGLIKKSDLKDASLAGDGTSIMRNGRVGMIDRFTIYNSNLLARTSSGGKMATETVFGHKTALTFATQLTESEGPMRSTDFFGDLYRGLQVFGFEVIKPEAIGHAHVYNDK